MTRLLFPSAFGQIAVVVSLLVGFSLISDVGIKTVVLQSPRSADEHFLQTAWTLQVGRGVSVWLVLVLLCTVMSLPLIRAAIPTTSVYSDPIFPFLTIIMGLTLITDDLESMAVQLNIKRLNMKPIYLLDLSGRITPLPIMIVWAWINPTVWALVAGMLATSIIRVILSHVLLPGPRMQIRWQTDAVREILHFGKWINLSSIASFVGTQSDRLILGILLPGSIFGVYAVAKTMIDMSQGFFDRLNTNLTLPVLSEVIHRDRRDLTDRYYRFRFPFDATTPLLGGFLFITGSLVVHILYDKRYADAGQMLQILAIVLLIYPSLLMRFAFVASGEPRVNAIMSIIQAAASVLLIPIGFRIDGMMGAIVGVALYQLAPSVFILFAGYKKGWVDFRKEARVLLTFLGGIAVGILVLAIAKSFGIAAR
jgi:O-antigen/teichoic acid export membrane protein